MTIQQKKKILHDYILLKLEENDLHGISDAANDLRVIEAYQAGMDAAIDLQRLTDKFERSQMGNTFLCAMCSLPLKQDRVWVKNVCDDCWNKK